MRKVPVLYLLGILAIGITLFIVLRPPGRSPYHPYVGTWELERGTTDSFQRIVLTPGQRVIVNGVPVPGEWTGSPSMVTIDTDNGLINLSIKLRRNQFYLYQVNPDRDQLHIYEGDDILSVYRRINNCWSPSHPHNTCD